MSSLRPRTSLLLVLALALTALCYSRSLQAPLIFDDRDDVLNTTGIRSWDSFVHHLSAEHGDKRIQLRPFLFFTYFLNYQLSGTAPAPYRAVDLALHLVCALLVFLAVKAMIAREREDLADPIALFVASVFALNPFASEAVILVSRRSTILCAALCLGALVSFQRSSRAGDRPALVALLLSLLALLTKESAAPLPAAFFLYRVLVHRDPLRQGIRHTWPFFSLTALLLAGRSVLAAGMFSQAMSATTRASSWTRYEFALTQLTSHARYWSKILVPWKLYIFYPIPPYRSLLEPAVLASAALLLAGLGLAAYYFRNRSPLHRALAMTLAWYALMLAPTSSVVPILELVAERHAYPAAFVPAVVLAVLWVRLGAPPRAGAALALAYVTVLLALNVRIQPRFVEEAPLWQAIIRDFTPPASRPTPTLGLAHQVLAESYWRKGRRADALREARRACDWRFRSGCEAFVIFRDLAASDEAPALVERLCVNGLPQACNSLALRADRAGRQDLALEYFRRGCAATPDICTNVSLILERRGDPAGAARVEREACLRGSMEACDRLGARLATRGAMSEARPWFARACERHHANGCVDLGLAEASLGDPSAMRHLTLGCALGASERCLALGRRAQQAGQRAEAEAILQAACEGGERRACR